MPTMRRPHEAWATAALFLDTAERAERAADGSIQVGYKVLGF